MNKWIAFLDFDGTITAEETLSGVLMSLRPPLVGFDDLVKQMLTRKISLKEGLYQIFSQIDSSRKGEFMKYIKTVPVRPGFEAFLKTCKKLEIPVIIVSGGLDIMVQDRLGPYMDLLTDVWSCHLDTTGEKMKLVSEIEGENEPMDKNAIISKYDFAHAFCVGDGFTDFEMARRADVVFARDELAKFMDSQKLDYIKFDDFYDIEKAILEGKYARN